VDHIGSGRTMIYVCIGIYLTLNIMKVLFPSGPANVKYLSFAREQWRPGLLKSIRDIKNSATRQAAENLGQHK